MNVCGITDCKLKYYAKGYCRKHYKENICLGICSVKDCTRWLVAREMCERHYRLFMRGSDVHQRQREMHGLRKTSTYQIWAQMRARCNNPKHKMYKYYGGRGIKVCDRWNDSFILFLEDMGVRPSGLTLERIDNDKGYFKENCKWATNYEQSCNQRPKKNNTGYPGVSISGNKFQARIINHGKRKSLGVFDTPDEAHQAYLKAKSKRDGKYEV